MARSAGAVTSPDPSGPSFRAVEASRSDFGRVSRCLAQAFLDDPVSMFLFPDDRTRGARLETLYHQVVGAMASHGRVETDPEIRAAAVWQAPSPPKPGRVAGLLGQIVMLSLLRTASRRALALNAAIEGAHPHEPHWYLGMLGTAPAHRGLGLASELIRPVLEQCDESGATAYLESSKEGNIPFYERHGFRVTGEVRVADGPTLWPMRRTARPPAASG